MSATIDLQAIRERATAGASIAAKAAPGPWKAKRRTVYDALGNVLAKIWPFKHCKCPDGVFIADARTRVPDLASDVMTLSAEVEALYAENARLANENSRLLRQLDHARNAGRPAHYGDK